MDRKQKARLAAMLFVKNHYLFEKKLKLLLLKLLHNSKIVHSLASTNLNLLVQLGIAEEHSEIRERQLWKFDRNSTFWESDVLSMDDNIFKDYFRLNRKAFQQVCETVSNIKKLNTNMRFCIPLDKRVAIALFALGSAAEYSTVGNLFGVGRSTVGEIVIDFCQAICNNMGHYINSYPPNPQEIKRIVDGFERLGFPQCFGAVDACHIEIQPTKENAVEYYNCKGWCSVVLLASCDYGSKFTYINIGSSGKDNDSYIFEKTSLKRFHESAEIFTQKSKIVSNINVPLLLIGDSAFRLSRYMMKPFPYSINQPDAEKIFNYRLFKCQRVVETAFIQLKARFRRIGRGLKVAPKNVNIIIKACCILHNFLKTEKDKVSSAWMETVAEDLTTRSQPNQSTRSGENDITASTIRNAIALSFNDESAAADEGAISLDGCGEEGEVVSRFTLRGDSNGWETGDGNGSDSDESCPITSGFFS